MREAGHTHELEDDLDLKPWLVRTQVHMGQTMDTTYMAIVWGCRVKVHQGKDHGHESRYARNRVDLWKGADKARVLGRATKPERKCASLQTHIVQR